MTIAMIVEPNQILLFDLAKADFIGLLKRYLAFQHSITIIMIIVSRNHAKMCDSDVSFQRKPELNH